MKVWELMKILAESAAGAEVVVGLRSTLNVAIESAEDDGDGNVIITGGDAEFVDANGDIAGTCSEVSRSLVESDD